MKLPSFQFYPGDWMKDPDLRRCSPAARGIWIDLICLMFECQTRGVLATSGVAWTNEEIAGSLSGNPQDNLRLVEELLTKGVARRNPQGAIYCKRLVEDERNRVGNSKRQQEKRARNGPVTPMSRGSSSSSSVSSSDSTLSDSESRDGKTDLELHTHRQPKLVCVPKSKFTLDRIREFAYASCRLDQKLISRGRKNVEGIRNPEGWAVVAHRSGEFDSIIQEWVDDPGVLEVAS